MWWRRLVVVAAGAGRGMNRPIIQWSTSAASLDVVAEHSQAESLRSIDREATSIHVRDLSRAVSSHGIEHMRDIYLGMIVNGMKPTLGLYHILLDETSRRGLLPDMFEYWQELGDFGLKPEEQSWNLMLSGCVKARDPSLGFQIWSGMKADHCHASATTFAHLLQLCSLNPLYYDRASGVWREMIDSGIQPNSGVISSVINCCRVRGDYEGGKRVFNEMPVKPDISSLNAIIHLCADEGDVDAAQSFYNDLRKSRLPNAFTYTYMLTALFKGGRLKQVDEILNELVERRIYIAGEEVSRMIQILLQHPNAQNLMKCDRLKDFTKNGSWSNVDSQALRQVFQASMNHQRLDLARISIALLLTRRSLRRVEAERWPRRLRAAERNRSDASESSCDGSVPSGESDLEDSAVSKTVDLSRDAST